MQPQLLAEGSGGLGLLVVQAVHHPSFQGVGGGHPGPGALRLLMCSVGWHSLFRSCLLKACLWAGGMNREFMLRLESIVSGGVFWQFYFCGLAKGRRGRGHFFADRLGLSISWRLLSQNIGIMIVMCLVLAKGFENPSCEIT